MSRIKNEYKSFLDDIEKNIKDKEDLKYIKTRFTKFLDVVTDEMDYIIEYKKEQIEALEQTQNSMEERMQKMSKIIDNIENDIYGEEGFDFEIICPYCNAEFIVDIDENKTEIECPECKNTIELDWTGELDEENHTEGGCSGSCHGCHGCSEEEEDDDDM